MSTAVPPIAVVTGGSSGIGSAIVDRLVNDGFDVHVWDAHAVERAGVISHIVDVSDGSAVKNAAAAFERIDVLVNAAGIAGSRAPMAEVPFDEWDRVMAVDLNGPYYCAVALYPALHAASGVIINIASTAAQLMQVGRAHYSVAKAALITLTKSLAYEWAPAGVRVIAVSPGYTRTPLVQRAVDAGELDEARISRLSRMGRLAEPAEIAHVVVTLTTPGFSYVTGENITVDGGSTLGPVVVASNEGSKP